LEKQPAIHLKRYLSAADRKNYMLRLVCILSIYRVIFVLISIKASDPNLSVASSPGTA
jgi:hypothetical protein